MLQKTIFLVLLFLFVLFLLNQSKKRREKQMGEDLDYYIEKEDWQAVSSILRKQLIVWSAIAIFTTIVSIASFFIGNRPKYVLLVFSALFIWRVCKLAKNYLISRDNEKYNAETEEEAAAITEIATRLQDALRSLGCNVTMVDSSKQDVTESWLEACKRGEREGYHPVMVHIDRGIMDSMADDFENDPQSFRQWQQQILTSPVADGKELLKERFDELKKDYVNDGNCDWQEDIVGTAQSDGAINQLSSDDTGKYLLAEIPVSKPWEVFAYIPIGDWNNCPPAEEHMAIAKYWYEKYGAVVASIGSDLIDYYVPKPVTENNIELAEEKFAYCDDVLQNFGNLATLAEFDKNSTVWSLWWD